MGKKYDFDYIIIGSGAAGRTAATNLIKKFKKVAIVEGRTFGGLDYNFRDIPYNIGLDFAHTYHKAQNFPATSGSDFHFNLPTLVAHQNYISSSMSKESQQSLEEKGIICLNGYAHFLDSNTIAVGTNEYTSKNFIIATGSKLKTSEINGLDTVNYLTPDTALKVSRLPKFVFVIGGGSTGCEIASYYASLGTKVLIMERSPRILPREDKEVSVTLTEYFKNELGMMVIPNSRVVAIEQDELSKRVIFTSEGQEKAVRVDCIVLATGAEPMLDCGLANAGVKYKRTGIIVNKLFQTSAKNIYALGDCLGHNKSSTELAEYEASLLTSNLIHKTKATPSYSGFTRCTNTYPEVAVVGFNEKDLLARDKKYKKSIFYLKDLPFSKIEPLGLGFVKILADSNNRILGATVVAPNASLIIEELSIAVRHHINLTTIASTPHIANTFNPAVKLAAKKLIK